MARQVASARHGWWHRAHADPWPSLKLHLLGLGSHHKVRFPVLPVLSLNFSGDLSLVLVPSLPFLLTASPLVTVTGHHWKSWSEAGLHLFCGSAPDNRPLLGQWLSLLSLAVWRLCTVPSPTPAAMKESLQEEHFGGSAVCNSCGLPGAGTAGPSVISPSSCWLSSACLLSQGVGLIQDY